MIESTAAAELAHIVLRSLSQGKVVEIDGLGVFFPDPQRGVRFEPRAPQVFLAYVKEDQYAVGELYESLGRMGFSPWMDVRKLLPGQNWPRAIEAAIETSDFFIACFSRNSVNKWAAFKWRSGTRWIARGESRWMKSS